MSSTRNVLDHAVVAISRARRGGLHRFEERWRFSADIATNEVVDSILAWCRETLGACRRPFGINYFDFNVAFATDSDQLGWISLRKLEPISLYGEVLPGEMGAIVERRGEAGPTRQVFVSATIFSWGEAAHTALPARI